MIGMVWISFRIDQTLAPALDNRGAAPLLRDPLLRHPHPEAAPQVKGMEADSLSIVHDAMSMLPVITAFQREDHELGAVPPKPVTPFRPAWTSPSARTLFSLAVNTTTAVGTALVLGVGRITRSTGRADGRRTARRARLHRRRLQAARDHQLHGRRRSRTSFIALRMAFDLLDTEPIVTGRPPPPTRSPARPREIVSTASASIYGRVDTLKDISFDGQARAGGRHRRADRRRQDHAGQPDPALLRSERGAHPARRPGHPRRSPRDPCARRSAWCCRTAAVLGHDRRQHPLRPPGGEFGRDRRGASGRPTPTTSSRGCPAGYDTEIGERGVAAVRAASASASASRARF